MYLQDDWKLGSRATLNVGLRWDYQPPVTVKDNLTVSDFDFNATNPLQSQLPQGAATINPATGQPLILIGGLLFANRGGPKSPYKNDWNNIQPRVGFTYRINDWLIGRANYGRSYLGLSSGGQNGVYTTDFQRTTPFIAKAPNGVDPGTPWANPFPDGFLQPLARRAGTADGARHRAARSRTPTTRFPTPISGWRASTSSCRGTSASTSPTSATR